jgi:hypothetical protein
MAEVWYEGLIRPFEAIWPVECLSKQTHLVAKICDLKDLKKGNYDSRPGKQIRWKTKVYSQT